ncbi:fimbrial protein [Escherichia coli]
MKGHLKPMPHYRWITNDKKPNLLHQIYSGEFTGASVVSSRNSDEREKNNLHFTGNLIDKSCTLVAHGGLLAEVRFPTISSRDLSTQMQSGKVSMAFELENCKGSSQSQNSVKVTFTGTEDTGQPRIFLALDSDSQAQGVGIGIETVDGVPVKINNNSGATFVLSDGSNTLLFNIWVQAKSGRDVTLGNFTATATATFEYL